MRIRATARGCGKCRNSVLAGPRPTRTPREKNAGLYAVLEETVRKPQPLAPVPSGPELAAMMKIGTRVIRGADWKWGDQVRCHGISFFCGPRLDF